MSFRVLIIFVKSIYIYRVISCIEKFLILIFNKQTWFIKKFIKNLIKLTKLLLIILIN